MFCGNETLFLIFFFLRKRLSSGIVIVEPKIMLVTNSLRDWKSCGFLLLKLLVSANYALITFSVPLLMGFSLYSQNNFITGKGYNTNTTDTEEKYAWQSVQRAQAQFSFFSHLWIIQVLHTDLWPLLVHVWSTSVAGNHNLLLVEISYNELRM